MLANLRLPLLAVVAALTMTAHPDAAEARRKAAKAGAEAAYVLEFRSRPTGWVGHSHVVARKVDARGRTTMRKVAGFWPDPAIPRLMIPFGSRGVVEARKGDLAHATRMHSVRVDRATFQKAVAKMERIARQRPNFDPFTQNCNTFVAVVARTAGVKAPRDSFQLPDDYIGQMRAMNAPNAQRRRKLAAG